MEISKYNAEGYYDPTAYEGICRAEGYAWKLKIIYPAGCLELALKDFFPCTLAKARKVFSLIHKYSPESDKDKLVNFFRNLSDGYSIKMQDYAAKAASFPKNSYERNEYALKFKKARHQRQKIVKNLQLFTDLRDKR